MLGKYILLARKSIVTVIMHRDSTAADVLQAFMHSLVLAKLDDKNRSMHFESQSWMAKNYEDFVLKVFSSSIHVVLQSFLFLGWGWSGG